MRPEYSDDIRKLRSSLVSLGYSSCNEEDYKIEFHLHNKWVVTLATERYGYGRALLVVPPAEMSCANKEYAVWLLMIVFERLTEKTMPKPSMDAQLHFLIENKSIIFVTPAYYDGEYSKINAID